VGVRGKIPLLPSPYPSPSPFNQRSSNMLIYASTFIPSADGGGLRHSRESPSEIGRDRRARARVMRAFRLNRIARYDREHACIAERVYLSYRRPPIERLMRLLFKVPP